MLFFLLVNIYELFYLDVAFTENDSIHFNKGLCISDEQPIYTFP